MCHICRRLGIDRPQIPYSDDEDAQEEEEWTDAQLAALPPAPRIQLFALPRTFVVTERAPSHDDAASTWAAYEVPCSVLPSPDSDYNSSVPADTRRQHRPVFGLRIYDATSDATAGRAEQLARRISELTSYQRLAPDSAQGDRIEVVALPSPLPPGRTTSGEDDEGEEEERIYALARACVAHEEAERAVRLAVSDPAEAASWYLVEDIFDGYGCRKRMWVIDDLPSSWEEGLRRGAERSRRGGALGAVSVGSAGGDGDDIDVGGEDGAHGHFLDVRYDRDPDSYGDEEDEEREREGKPPLELYVTRHPLEKLGAALASFRGVRGNVFTFYQTHFIPDGVLDRELAAARAGGGIGGGETASLAGTT
jgi:hypothetical protein